jgi:tetratricopeptide (TPR) repeat protein
MRRSGITRPRFKTIPPTRMHVLRGYAYRLSKRYKDAVDDFTRALALDPPNLVPAYMQRAIAYVHLQKYTQALADMMQAAKLEPDDELIYRFMGLVEGYRRHYSAAALDFTRAIEMSPGDYRAYSYRCSAYQMLNRHAQAIADCTHLLVLNPDYKIGYVKRADLYIDDGRYNLALADEKRAIAYEVLWLHLARLRNHQADTAEFAANSKTETSNTWSRRLLGFYAGTVTKRALFHAAANAGERCEADFYAAELSALHDDTALARKGFSQALQICPHDYIEYTAAGPGLKALR